MKIKKFICEGCEAQVNDTQKFCHECGVGLQPITDASVEKELKDFLRKNNIKYTIDPSTDTFKVKGKKDNILIGTLEKPGVVKYEVQYENKSGEWVFNTKEELLKFLKKEGVIK